MQTMDSHVNPEQPRKSLLFFAPERKDAAILEAYDIYLHHLSHSKRFDITIMAPNGSPFAEDARSMGYKMYPISGIFPQAAPTYTAAMAYPDSNAAFPL